ncbi:MAG: HAD family phosphatase [Synergistaceae bacterium]|nr:HAD family phosphatase [Synergistaceae bacterium]
MGEIKLIAFDLDDTILNTKKKLSPETLRVLYRAAELGIEIVPSTGRFWGAVTDEIKNLPFVRYAVTLNGAAIYDVKNQKAVAHFEIPSARAETMARVFDELHVIYDSIIDGQGYMNREFREKLKDITIGEWQYKIIYDLRKPVEDLHEIINKSSGVQKMQIYTKDSDLRERLLAALPVVFPNSLFTSSVPNNIEINDLKANKGDGLRFIASHLGIDMSEAMAFGDGLNDISMIKAAGIGVAMGNAVRELKDVADHVTGTCDEDGVAEGIKTFCVGIDDK